VSLGAPGLRMSTSPATEPADVLVEWHGAVEAPEPPGADPIMEPSGGWLEVSSVLLPEGEGTRLRFGHAGHHVAFDIAPGGSRVAVGWTQAVLPSHASTLLFSTVLGFLLHCRGRLAIHAAAIARDGVAFLFAGAPGAGKSTTAAAIAHRGGAVISDDIAAIARDGDRWAVHAGLASVRLAPEARRVLGIAEDRVAPVWPRSPDMAETDHPQVDDKEVLVTEGIATNGPIRLAGIFLLAPRADSVAAPRIRPLRGADAVVHLAPHVVVPAWLTGGFDQRRFTAIADLADTTPVGLVERADALSSVPSLCEELLAAMDDLSR
jgi:hypothetical protein